MITSEEALAEVFLLALGSLPRKDRDAVLAALVKDKRLREDLVDLTIAEEREKEPSRPLKEGTSIIDLKHFLSFSGELKEETLHTQAQAKPFRVEVFDGHLKFFPGSTQIGRDHQLRNIRAVHERYTSTGSLRLSDYTDLTRNASYSLVVLQRYVEHLPSCPGHKTQ